MKELATKITIVGSFEQVNLPSELASFFVDGIFINRFYKKPMEMDAYSLYLGLKALERRGGSDFSAERKLLADAIVRRMRQCGGFWAHNSWTSGEREVHMRFTAAAIRLLGEAWSDRIITDSSIVVDALKRHLSYREEIQFGTWFFHDSLEGPGICREHPSKPAKNSVWRSTSHNCLVLNTHLDTLSTTLHLMNRLEMSQFDRDLFRGLTDSGLAALAGVLSNRVASRAKYFAKADVWLRDLFFRLFTARTSKRITLLRKAIGKVCFTTRKHIQPLFPGYAFPDGYIGRDIGVRLYCFEYHMHDTCDLAKLLLQLQDLPGGFDDDLLKQWGSIVDRALDYTVGSTYFRYVLSSMKETGRAISICETILARLGAKSHRTLPDRWKLGYCQVRRSVSPTPALIGYDPFVVREVQDDCPTRDGWDVGTLRNGRRFAVNYLQDEFLLDAEAERVTLSWNL